MNERQLRNLIGQVKAGKLPRRSFIQQMVGLGLSAPTASMLLLHAGVAQAQTVLPPYKPTKRGGGGTLKLLWWQGPVHLNPQWATGTKEQEGSRLFYEPLAAWDNDGNLYPVLAAELPSPQNGGVSADGKVVKHQGTMSMGPMEIPSRSETVYVDKDTVKFTMWHSMGGQESMAMEAVYKRVK